MEVVSDWSALPSDVLMDIGRRVLSASVEDLMALRGVCGHWRSAVRSGDFIKSVESWPATPFLMLSEKEGSEDREFYSLSKRKVCMRLRLPEAKDRRCLESRFGWLLTFACSGDIQLLNPYTRARIELPNFKTFPDYDNNRREPEFDSIGKSVLSANPSDTSDFVVVVYTTFNLGFWRNGDRVWTQIRTESRSGAFRDLTWYQGKLYAIDGGSQIWVWDPVVAPAAAQVMEENLAFSEIEVGSWRPYMVESPAGELLLVSRDGQFGVPCYGATQLRVFKIDLETVDSQLITSLGKDAIFIGHSASISIRYGASTTIMPNAVYFSDDSIEPYGHNSPYEDEDEDEDYESEQDADEDDAESGCESEGWLKATNGWKAGTLHAGEGGGKDMGVYSLETCSIQRFGEVAETLSFSTPPLWVAPFAWLC